jgi:hypothetical protein
MSDKTVCVLLHTSGYNHSDVSVVGVYLSRGDAEQARNAHPEPGNCTVEESRIHGTGEVSDG